MKKKRREAPPLSDIVVEVWVLLITAHVVAVDEALDALLEVGRLDGEAELGVELRHQQRVRQRLTRLHHPHNSRVDLILTVLE